MACIRGQGKFETIRAGTRSYACQGSGTIAPRLRLKLGNEQSVEYAIQSPCRRNDCIRIAYGGAMPTKKTQSTRPKSFAV